MNHVAKKQNAGFTLIELILAMTFISILLLAIAMTVIQVGSMYNKGMTLKETNQTGRDIATDIQRDIAASKAFSLTTDYLVVNGGAPANGTGRLCLGSATYIWNLGNTPTGSRIKYSSPAKAAIPINLVKVPDANKLYCAKNPNNTLMQTDIRTADTDNAKELLAGDHSLIVYKFALAPGSANTVDSLTEQQLYQLSFTISTDKISAIDTTKGTCLPPGNINSDMNYCSVQDFSLVVRAGKKVNL